MYYHSIIVLYIYWILTCILLIYKLATYVPYGAKFWQGESIDEFDEFDEFPAIRQYVFTLSKFSILLVSYLNFLQSGSTQNDKN